LEKGAMPGQCTRFKPFQRFKTNVALRVQREALEIKAICDSATTTVPLATVVKLIQFSLAPLCGNWYTRAAAFISKTFPKPTKMGKPRSYQMKLPIHLAGGYESPIGVGDW
jgi:hypothetical protein